VPHARALQARGPAARSTVVQAGSAARTSAVHAHVRRGCTVGHLLGVGHTGAITEARTIGVHAPVRRGCPEERFLGVSHTGASAEAYPVSQNFFQTIRWTYSVDLGKSGVSGHVAQWIWLLMWPLCGTRSLLWSRVLYHHGCCQPVTTQSRTDIDVKRPGWLSISYEKRIGGDAEAQVCPRRSICTFARRAHLPTTMGSLDSSWDTKYLLRCSKMPLAQPFRRYGSSKRRRKPNLLHDTALLCASLLCLMSPHYGVEMPTTQFVLRQSRYVIELTITLRTERSLGRCCYTSAVSTATNMTIHRNFAVASNLARPTPSHRRAVFSFLFIHLSCRARQPHSRRLWAQRGHSTSIISDAVSHRAVRGGAQGRRGGGAALRKGTPRPISRPPALKWRRRGACLPPSGSSWRGVGSGAWGRRGGATAVRKRTPRPTSRPPVLEWRRRTARIPPSDSARRQQEPPARRAGRRLGQWGRRVHSHGQPQISARHHVHRWEVHGQRGRGPACGGGSAQRGRGPAGGGGSDHRRGSAQR